MFKENTAKTAEEYIATLEEPRKSEIEQLHALIRETVPGLKPITIYGMIGYGPFHYKYASGREGEATVLSLASQKNYISLYVNALSDDKYIAEKYADKLGKVSVGKSCVRFKTVADIDLAVVKEMLLEAEQTGGAGAV